jgi:hypothetical protein
MIPQELEFRQEHIFRRDYISQHEQYQTPMQELPFKEERAGYITPLLMKSSAVTSLILRYMCIFRILKDYAVGTNVSQNRGKYNHTLLLGDPHSPFRKS